MDKKIKMEGLTCSSCARKITDKIKEDQNVIDAKYNLVHETMVIEYQVEINEKKELKKIKKIVNSYEDGVKVHFYGSTSVESESIFKMYMFLIIGALVFTSGFIINNMILITIGYLLFVSKIAKKAFSSLTSKSIFDENMLMFIATVAAMAIGEHVEAMAVILFYTVGDHLQYRAVNKSKGEISSLIELKVEYANVFKENILKRVEPTQIKIGDKILIKPGEKVPVDCKITSGYSVLDTSSITGESKPLEASAGDIILSGMINTSGVIEAIAEKEYKDSTISLIVEMLENSTLQKANTEKFITKFAKYYTPIVTILALLIFAVPSIIHPEAYQSYMYRAAVFLVISCPCALVISIPLTYYAGIGKNASMGVLYKGSNHLDNISKVTDVYLDKTGTITHGNFAVSEYTNEETLKLAASIEKYSNHPISQAVVSSYSNELVEVKNVEEKAGYGLIGTYNNKELIVGNKKLMKIHNIKVNIEEDFNTIVYVSYDNQLIGNITIKDEIKETSKNAIDLLKHKNICVTMLTGDNEGVAKDISEKVGNIEYKANLLPNDKSEYILNKEVKGKTLFVGDGINDAVALANADIAVTMGQKGSDLAIEVSDVIILNDDLSKLPKSINIANKTKKIVYQNIIGTLSIKFLFLMLGAIGLSTMWMAIFADVGVSLIAVLNSLRILISKE